ncbi:hypothetical protein E3E22_00400 [Thermococcus sp. MV5]|uniref:DUF257 family protein n=1 Tax=Thermococcus sp. MV5 TaxID=1638272 RepID=UPI001438E939|nr:DUF257 family protein [Thermococcus sp. MV5]NJE25112.1 hypothetical protein [Thermococcus sp. MV5]
MSTISTLLENLKFGESILIEHSSTAPVHILFYELIKWAELNSYPILIDDFLDSLYLYKKHIKLSGLSNQPINNVVVIKLGGILEVGHVIGKVSVSESTILQKEYDYVFERVPHKRFLNIVVGFDKYLFLLQEKKELLSALHDILKYVGNKRRIAFYFINQDLIEVAAPAALPILEEGFTRVVRIGRNESAPPTVKLLKSIVD